MRTAARTQIHLFSYLLVTHIQHSVWRACTKYRCRVLPTRDQRKEPERANTPHIASHNYGQRWWSCDPQQPTPNGSDLQPPTGHCLVSGRQLSPRQNGDRYLDSIINHVNSSVCKRIYTRRRHRPHQNVNCLLWQNIIMPALSSSRDTIKFCMWNNSACKTVNAVHTSITYR